MVRAVLLLLGLSFSSGFGFGQTSSGSFARIAKQADEARASDHLNDALHLYAQGVRLRPSWAEGWWWMGSLLYEQDRFSEAQTAFQRFVKISAKPAPAYAFLALCEYETRDYDRALQHFQTWAQKGSPGTDDLIHVASFHWAVLLTRQRQFSAALYLLDPAAKKLGASPALTEAMGLASLRIPNLPEDYPPEQRERVWLAGKAAFYSVIEEYSRAQDYADKLLLHYNHEPNVHYFRGTLLGFEGKNAAAMQEYQQELQLTPNHVPALVELALLHMNNQHPEEAVPLAEHAVALEPDDSRAHYALGCALLETNHVAESARELETAKNLAPDSGRIRFALAKAYQKLGRKEDAQRETNAFLALKDKEEVFAPLEEKLKPAKEAGRP